MELDSSKNNGHWVLTTNFKFVFGTSERTGSPFTLNKIDGWKPTKIFGGSLFNCTPAGTSFFGVDAMRLCREIEKVGGTNVLNNCSIFSAVALSSDGKYVPVISALVMVTSLATLSMFVFPFISTTPTAVFPVFGVSEIAIRQLKS